MDVLTKISEELGYNDFSLRSKLHDVHVCCYLLNGESSKKVFDDQGCYGVSGVGRFSGFLALYIELWFLRDLIKICLELPCGSIFNEKLTEEF